MNTRDKVIKVLTKNGLNQVEAMQLCDKYKADLERGELVGSLPEYIAQVISTKEYSKS